MTKQFLLQWPRSTGPPAQELTVERRPFASIFVKKQVTHGKAMQMPRAKEAPPVVLTARISAAVKAALTKEAKADSRTISSLVNKILEDWMRANASKK
jgi:hypothetical protein